MMKRVVALLILVAAGTLSACGGSSPAAPNAAPGPGVSPSPSAAPSPSPSPSTAPPPCSQGLCEDPTTNTNPPAHVGMRIYYVMDRDGSITKLGEGDKFPLGYTVLLDVGAKDASNKPTNGNSEVEFKFTHPEIAEIHGTHPFQRRVTGIQPGVTHAWAVLQGVKSGRVMIEFYDDRAK